MRHIITAVFFVSWVLLSSSVNAFTVPYHRSTRENVLAHGESSVKQNITSRNLERRFDDARFTFYDAGLGACGKTNSGSDFIVALNAAQYDGGAHCFQTITITVGSKSTSAEIVDECPGCPFGGLDFSRGLFDFFAPESIGVLTGSWNFGGGGGGAAPAPSPSPTTHTVHTTTTPAAPKATVHNTPQPTLTSAATTSAQAVAAAAASRSASTSESAEAAAATVVAEAAAATVVAAAPVNNLQQMNLVMVQLGSLIMAGGVNESS